MGQLHRNFYKIFEILRNHFAEITEKNLWNSGKISNFSEENLEKFWDNFELILEK